MSGGLGSTLGIFCAGDCYPTVSVATQPMPRVSNTRSGLKLKNATVALPDTDYSAGVILSGPQDPPSPELPGATFSAAAYTGSHNLNLPTALVMRGQGIFVEPLVGSSFEFTVVNDGSSGNVTVVPGAGGSPLGTMVVPNGKSAQFRVRMTDVDVNNPAYQVINVGYLP